MHRSSSAEALDKGVDLFNRGQYESARTMGCTAIGGIEPEPGAHGLVGTCDLYLRKRTPSPVPETPLTKSTSYSIPNTRSWGPSVPAYSILGVDDGPEVSREYPNLHPEPSYDDFEYARRLREQERRMQQEERLAREEAERARRRREAEQLEAQTRAAEEARIQRDMELRARARQQQEDESRRRALDDAEDRARNAEKARDHALSELTTIQSSILHDRESFITREQQQQNRVKDLESQLRDARDRLDRELNDPRMDPRIVDQLQRELDNDRAEITRLRADFESQRQSLTADRDALAARQRPLENQVDTLQMEVSRLSNALSLSQAERDRDLADLQKQHANEKLGLETNFAVLRDITSERDNLRQTVVDRDRQIQDLQNLIPRIKELEDRIVHQQHDMHRHHSEETRLQRELRDLEARTRERQLQEEDLHRRSLADADERLKNAEKARDNAVSEFTSLQTTIIHERETHTTRDTQFQSRLDDMQNQLRAQDENSRRTINSLTDERDSLRQQLIDRDRQMDALKGLADRVKELEDRLQLQQYTHGREKQDLQKDLDESNRKFDDLLGLLEHWKAERHNFDARTDLLITKADRTPSPSKRPPSPYSSAGYSPERYSPGFSPQRSESGAAM